MKEAQYRFLVDEVKTSDRDLSNPEISIIIPTLNEAPHIARLISRLRDNASDCEIILVDGGSTDGTLSLAESLDVKVINFAKPSRPEQMNAGAKAAKSDLLYFVHADTLPPEDFDRQVLQAVENGAQFGSFRFRFDSPSRALKFTAYFTRFPVMMVRGGDQTLFVKKDLFWKVGGFDRAHVVMEEYDLIRKCKKHAPFTLIQDDVLISARKYEANSYPRVNISNLIVFTLYYCGVKPQKLLKLYKKLIRHPKA